MNLTPYIEIRSTDPTPEHIRLEDLNSKSTFILSILMCGYLLNSFPKADKGDITALEIQSQSININTRILPYVFVISVSDMKL